MEYPAVICVPASPSQWPLFLDLPPSQSPAPAAHRPLQHILLQVQSCKMKTRDKARDGTHEARFEFYGGNDPEDPPPKNFSSHRRYPSYPNLTRTRTLLPGTVPKTLKTRKTGLIEYTADIVPGSTFASSAPSSSVPTIAHEFHVEREVGNLITTLFLVGLWPGLREKHDDFACHPLYMWLLRRRTPHQQLWCDCDMWDPMNRGIATSVFASAVFLGPVLGPIVGSFITTSSLGWRWVFWQALTQGNPEKNKDLYTESERVSWAPRAVLERTIFRPFKMLLVEPICCLRLSTSQSPMVSSMRCFSNTRDLHPHRHFSISNDGLIFIGIGIGPSLPPSGAPVLRHAWWTHPGHRHPLARLERELRERAMVGSGLSTILIGLAITLVFISFISYLVDTYLIDWRGIPTFHDADVLNLGINWAATLLGGIALLLAPMPFLFYKYGPRIRTKSSFAPCIDLKVAKFLEDEARAERGKPAA
ncbi:hypothetical protein BGY98DRAFT_1097344 [Russula aff. rugulosa BPL654]|nr:hypothetical protein BGY98DRAFT_1097344 [Russula aff. rugulosa BPL654]